MLFLGRPALRGMAGAGHRHGHGMASPQLESPEPQVETQFRVEEARVVDRQLVGDVVYYQIRVKGEGGEEWTVEHRYESFRALYSHLDADCYTKTVCDFPSRFWFFSLTESDIAIRQRELQIWLLEIISILRSENGPHGATKKEFEKAKVLVNQFLAADSHMKPNIAPTIASRNDTENYDYPKNESTAQAYQDNSSSVTMVNAYPVGESDKNK